MKITPSVNSWAITRQPLYQAASPIVPRKDPRVPKVVSRGIMPDHPSVIEMAVVIVVVPEVVDMVGGLVIAQGVIVAVIAIVWEVEAEAVAVAKRVMLVAAMEIITGDVDHLPVVVVVVMVPLDLEEEIVVDPLMIAVVDQGVAAMIIMIVAVVIGEAIAVDISLAVADMAIVEDQVAVSIATTEDQGHPTVETVVVIGVSEVIGVVVTVETGVVLGEIGIQEIEVDTVVVKGLRLVNVPNSIWPSVPLPLKHQPQRLPLKRRRWFRNRW